MAYPVTAQSGFGAGENPLYIEIKPGVFPAYRDGIEITVIAAT
jgi:hypothetical protein